ncbi:MAG: hypothetical protein KGH72_05700 [Candidatus Micrarchaeota archaeon]|nr:hypothetical protein [Candidatus Micrarchaeota archaeon]
MSLVQRAKNRYLIGGVLNDDLPRVMFALRIGAEPYSTFTDARRAEGKTDGARRSLLNHAVENGQLEIASELKLFGAKEYDPCTYIRSAVEDAFNSGRVRIAHIEETIGEPRSFVSGLMATYNLTLVGQRNSYEYRMTVQVSLPTEHVPEFFANIGSKLSRVTIPVKGKEKGTGNLSLP